MMRLAVGVRQVAASGGKRRRALEQSEVVHWLTGLRVEHRDLDEVIEHLVKTGHADLMRIQRLKKRKLKLKDAIAKLESDLIPNLDA